MAHLALYRTYRPKDFDAVVGQKHIVQTVKNQITHDLIAHAYMLTGPRGTGKTSIARIVAKAVNCLNPQGGNPCNTCESCMSVNVGNHPDVFELDGASNNGVDEIRDIRDRVHYAPTLSAYKVYIIDEVHMLSTGAFNALLKTLEEPPAHVIFMLATTEIHKVPDTILSRVQRFDLKQIPTDAMRTHLEQILLDLNVPFEPGVPELVATLANGGLRDALSMLDQAIAYKDEQITVSDVHDLNGSVAVGGLAEILTCIHAHDFAGISGLIKGLLASGKLPGRILDGLMGLLRDVLKIQKLGGADTTALAGVIESKTILHYIKELNQLAYELRIATDSELMLEIGLIALGFEEAQPSPQPLTQVTQPNKESQQAIDELKEMVKGLQLEIATLMVNTKAVGVGGSAVKKERQQAVPAALVQPDFPVYVQGELVNQQQQAQPLSSMPSEAIISHDLSLETQVGQSAGTVVPKNLLIEDVLASATKDYKAQLVNVVANANPFARLDEKEIIMLFKDAQIVAVSLTACVFVYHYETVAAKLLQVADQARDVLGRLVGRELDFLVLPQAFWKEACAQYMQQLKAGEKPQLKQYPQVVQVLPVVEKVAAGELPFYQEVVDMFGEMVEVVE